MDGIALQQVIIERTTRWVERVVIGLNLCPFAKPVHGKGLVRYVVSGATTTELLLGDLQRELLALALRPASEIETTLLIHPYVLIDFGDYNDFLSDGDALLETLELSGVLQLASFHPDYRFADVSPSDPANHTNRSPYPMLHLLREDSVTRAVQSFPEASTIYERNIQTLRALKPEMLAQLLADDD